MEDQNPVVNQEPTTPASEPIIKKEEVIQAPAVQAGDKTDPNLLLKSLQEEREKRRIAEQELETFKSSALSESEEDVFSDEGKVLKKEIGALKSELSEVKSELTKKDLLIAHPILKDKMAEFEEFRSDPENKGMNLRTAAKAFLVENGLLDVSRKGLEKPTGGQRVPMSSGMTADDVKTLRETNFKKYQELLMKGQIKIE